MQESNLLPDHLKNSILEGNYGLFAAALRCKAFKTPHVQGEGMVYYFPDTFFGGKIYQLATSQ